MSPLRRDVFQAIADPTRREIIELLSGKPLHLNAVADAFPVSRPAISRQMKILTECGLVVVKKEGRERYCHVRPGPLKEVNEWTAKYRRFWNEKLDALEDFLQKEKRQKRQ